MISPPWQPSMHRVSFSLKLNENNKKKNKKNEINTGLKAIEEAAGVKGCTK